MDGVNQQFAGAVGDVAGRDVVHHNYSLGRLLTKAERVELNKLVQLLESEFGEPGWQTWKFLHRTVGVENIETMYLGHRDQAETILGLLLDRAKLQREYAEAHSNFTDVANAFRLRDDEVKKLLARLEGANRSYAELHGQYLAAKANPLRSRAVEELMDKLQATGQQRNDVQRRYESAKASLTECQSRFTAAEATAGAFRRRWLWSSAAAGVASCLTLLLSYDDYKLRSAVRAIEARLSVCEFEGKAYGVGSSISPDDGTTLKCAVSQLGRPEWQQSQERPKGRAKT